MERLILQIKQLSHSGQLLDCLNCFSGQVTVLRAHVDSDLTPYRNALCGRSGKERFSILLDDSEFLPEMGRLVGFGERLPSEKTVEEILSDANIPEDLSHSLLVSYGLEEYKTTACKQLSECSARRIQLLLATHSSEKVLILDGPFEPLSSQWKERFAELILNDARNKNRITIITRLSFRPENWVGNEMIARLQVGQTVQKTIGFGSNPSEVHAVVGQLRSLLNDEEKVQKILSGQVQVDPNLLSQIKSGSESIAEQRANEPLSKNDSSEFDLKIESKEPLSGQARIQSAYYQYRYISRAAIGMAALVVATFIVALVLKFSSANQSETKIAKLEIPVATEKSTSSTSKPSNSGPSQSEKSSNTVQKPENLNSKPSSEEKNLLSALESNPTTQTTRSPIENLINESPKDTRPKLSPYELERYPQFIRTAIVNSFNSPQTTNEIEQPTEHTKQQPAIGPSGLEALNRLPESSEPDSPGGSLLNRLREGRALVENSSQSGESLEERQAKLREKFMQAINKAIEAKNNQ